MGQDGGDYVDIPHGSQYYIYDNGNSISGWSDGEFAALIGLVADEISIPEPRAFEIKKGFKEHFGDWDEDYVGGITPPERAYVFCQCVDWRIDSLELTDDVLEAVRGWSDNCDVLRECKYCGDEFRPVMYNDETPYVCNEDGCVLQMESDNLNIAVDLLEQAERLGDILMMEYEYSPEAAIDAEDDYLNQQTDGEYRQ